MRLSITSETHFARTPDGAVWADGPTAYLLWSRCLSVFEHVNVIARVGDVPCAAEGWRRADGAGVSFSGVPNYFGPWQYLLRARHVRSAARRAVLPDDAIILSVSGQIANCIEPLLAGGRPFAVQVVADPYDVFSPSSVKHPLRPFFRWWFPRKLRRQCRRADAALYVTQQALQRRYPCPAHEVGVSDVDLPASAIADAPRPFDGKKHCFRLLIVGTLAQLYKAPDVLVEAVGRCVQDGLDLRLTLIGDGKHRAELAARAEALGISDRVEFLGQLPAGAAIRAELDKADLFVLPSRQEGLPRALVEAMARGLPCIGSHVGGFPELLLAEDLVCPNDVDALAGKIREVVSDPARLARMSQHNLAKSREYSDDQLRAKREAFWRRLKQRTTEWIGARRTGELRTTSTARTLEAAHG